MLEDVKTALNLIIQTFQICSCNSQAIVYNYNIHMNIATKIIREKIVNNDDVCQVGYFEELETHENLLFCFHHIQSDC